MKTVVGFREHVTLLGAKKSRKVLARVDTGATRTSIDTKLAKSLGLGPVVRYKRVKSAHGTSMRGLVVARIRIQDRTFKVYCALADRKHMKYAVLIGRNILKRGFVIDSAKKTVNK
jgi:hypothetical protein